MWLEIALGFLIVIGVMAAIGRYFDDPFDWSE
jgi:hypothetical protein